jgi:Protein of unknown function (DUF2811)
MGNNFKLSSCSFSLQDSAIDAVHRVTFPIHPTTLEVLMHATVSILAEIPEELHESLKGYLENHPDWDQDRVFSAALSLFLLQNGTSDSPEASRSYRRAARVYLDTLFKHAV